ncbi:hypothetical protein [Cryptosporangium minutisporangium]|uniref:ABC transporter permease n=1 Tax=Cryptosporangium minutisporangium TaxID=113569 RepID=A0ABP6SU63_9ACTN
MNTAAPSHRVVALTRVRVRGYTRSRRALAPLIATLGLLAVVHAGGAAPIVEAYGISALVLLPVLAWQAKLALDLEPDAQRLLAATAVGGAGREVVAGLVAAAVPATVTVLVALAVPWVFGAIAPPESGGALVAGLAFGLWVHLLAVATGLAIGAWASRAVGPDLGRATLTLVGGVVLVLALGSGAADPLGWLVPRLTATVRAASAARSADIVLLSVHTVLWAAVVLAAYARTRLTRRP